MSNFKEDLKRVKAFVFDVDGVFSKSIIILHPSGDLMRTMNIKDGYAVHYLMKLGYPIAIISGGNSESVRDRFSKLGIKDIYLNSHVKTVDFENFRQKYDLDPADVLYMGDDLPDLPVMKSVGFPTCPADAVDEIKSVSSYISDKSGGEGCVRDIIEQVLKLHGKWMLDEAFSW
jgi:3-deoxy-D-manno-octulosonate 8-phosphate phosphatase (KDO 8-P phosphatase)